MAEPAVSPQFVLSLIYSIVLITKSLAQAQAQPGHEGGRKPLCIGHDLGPRC